jgi:hypothetical protein
MRKPQRRRDTQQYITGSPFSSMAPFSMLRRPARPSKQKASGCRYVQPLGVL